MPTTATALLDFESYGATAPAALPQPAAPRRRGPYTSAILRSVRKRERETLECHYDARGELRTIDAPQGARRAHLEKAGLHDGAGLTAAGREAAAEVNRASDRLAAGISYKRSAIRPRPVEPQAGNRLPPVRAALKAAPEFVNQGEVRPLEHENATVWWGTGHVVFPGPAPQRYAAPQVDIIRCDSMRRLVSRHEEPPKANTRRIVPVAITQQEGYGFENGDHVWLPNGRAIDKAHLAAIAHEHGPAGRLVFTTDDEYRRIHCAWALTDHGWRRLSIVATVDDNVTLAARRTARTIDDWLERLLGSHAGAEDTQP